MTKILILPLLVLGFSANAKPWTFIYSENGKWIEHTISTDKYGWPKTNQYKISDQKPRKRSTPLFSTQDHELKNDENVSLWPVTNAWSWDWELKFTDWVKAEVDASFWRKHGIATDCADAIISARWIFARNNGLPMANHLATGAWFTQKSVNPEWLKLPTAPEWYNDQRFMTAIDYLLEHTFTHSLWQDSYPVAVNPQALLPGGYHLSLHGDTGHTQFIYKVGTARDQVPLITLNSTVPREARDLMEFIFLDSNPDANGSGFVRMRWPVWVNDQVAFIPDNQMPMYSVEQFQPDFIQSPRAQFWEEVFYRLNPKADYNLIALQVIKQIRDAFKARVGVVEQGYKVCQAKHCDPGTPDYEAWSTPSRDHRLLDNINIFDQLLSYVTSGSAISEVLHTVVLHINDWDYAVTDLMSNWRASLYTSDPNDPPSRRWGI